MVKDLKYFMREEKEEIISVPGPESFKDENGEVIMLEIRVLDNRHILKINESYRKRSMALDKKGAPFIANGEVVFKTENDSTRAVQHIIVDALVYPNLKDPELMRFYGCVDMTEMPQRVFSKADEYTHVNRAVFAALGLAQGATDDDTIETAKN